MAGLLSFSGRNLGSYLLKLAFPRCCPGCGSVIAEGGHFCRLCLGKITPILHPFCPLCDLPLPQCPGHRGFRLSIYSCAWHDGVIAELIKQLKYQKRFVLGPLLGRFMARCAKKWRLEEAFDMTAPVPLHTERLRQRGFNQAAMFIKELNYPDPCLDLLLRLRPRHPQVGFDRQRRLANTEGLFVCNPRRRIQGRRVLLVDDVWTTGATLRACAQALTEAGAEAAGALTLSHTHLNREDRDQYSQ
jgi:ComF family protein